MSIRFKVVEGASNRKAVPVEIPKERPQEYYACKVFNRAKMFEYLPLDTYNALINAIDNKEPLSRKVADSVAEGMKRWAIDNGARHYTHWFQPLTETTAEKHEGNPFFNRNLTLQASPMVVSVTLLRPGAIRRGIFLLLLF